MSREGRLPASEHAGSVRLVMARWRNARADTLMTKKTDPGDPQ